MPARYWDKYEPDARMPWNLIRVVHLHRRAAFAASWDELQRDLKAGPEGSIDRLIRGEEKSHTPADFAVTIDLLAAAAATAGEINLLKAAWFYRMVYGPDPLGERLVLMWHDHFATGYAKVRNVRLMQRQNELFRSHARSKFEMLLNAVVRDPAILVYLDAPANRKEHPNENLARELMELFTVGIGNYSETDVKEAARCLTGWSSEEDKFVVKATQHDDGDKTLLGKTGKLTGTDLVDLLLKQPSTADRLADKLARTFFGEGGMPSRSPEGTGYRTTRTGPRYWLGCGDDTAVAVVFRQWEHPHSSDRPCRIHRWCSESAWSIRSRTKHSGTGRLVRANGARPV
jgi:hypothetical protein